jgi:hypothetical protein
MGRSRVQRQKQPTQDAAQVAVVEEMPRPTYTPIPDLTNIDVVFGNIKHLPRYETIPDRFKRMRDPYSDFISGWFFSGRTQEDMQKLKERPGVNRGKALAAIKAILASFEPKHEHKEAGCAFLLHEWFELTGARS